MILTIIGGYVGSGVLYIRQGGVLYRAPRSLEPRLAEAYAKSHYHPLICAFCAVLFIFWAPHFIYSVLWEVLGATSVRCWRRLGRGIAWDGYKRAVLWMAPTGAAARRLEAKLQSREAKDRARRTGNVRMQNLEAAAGQENGVRHQNGTVNPFADPADDDVEAQGQVSRGRNMIRRAT